LPKKNKNNSNQPSQPFKVYNYSQQLNIILVQAINFRVQLDDSARVNIHITKEF